MQISVKTNIREVLARMENYKRDVVDKAVVRALNRTAEMARTQALRELREEGYNFSASEIKQAISLVKAYAGKLSSGTRVRRQTKSLMEFSPRESKAGVTVKVHKGRKLIKHAFIGQLRNGRLGVYIEDKAAGKTVLRHAKQYKRGSRGGWHDYPVRKLYGPSVGGAYANERLQAIMGQLITSTFADRLQHELRYLSR